MSFEAVKLTGGQQSSHIQSTVTVSQVVTDVELVSRSTLLEATLASGRYTEFCDKKISVFKDQMESTIWSFLKVRLMIIIISFIGFGSQEGWITTDIKTYVTNTKTVSTHQLSDESQSVIKFSADDAIGILAFECNTADFIKIKLLLYIIISSAAEQHQKYLVQEVTR